jgi:hypothetical protein
MHRLIADGGGVPLGFYAELWNEQPDHPARPALERLAKVLGYERPAPYWLSESLLRDVLHAAGGVEYHALRVIAALDESQHQYNAYIEKYPEAAWRRDVEAQHFSVTEGLSWEYPNLLTWLRTVTERIVRETRGKRVGLLPAIADEELRADVELLLQGFKDRVGDERQLANYGLHAAKLPDPGTPQGVVQENNTLLVRIPDPTDEPIYVFDQFTYDQGRDLRSFTTYGVAATVELIDGLIDAFARANERVKTARGGRSLG